MKSFLLILLSLSCIAFLYLGNTYWQERTAVSSYNITSDNPSSEAVTSSSSAEPSEEIVPFANWPEQAQADYQAAVDNGETYKLALVGSPALGKDENGWSVQVKDALEEEYGESLEVSIFQYDTVSTDFIYGEDSDEVIDYAPDMVLFEPFSLNDNSRGVSADDNQYSIEFFLKELLGANEDVVMLLQPSHPIDGATYYPRDIEGLKEFAKEKDITYLDHWTAWPDSEELKSLLAEKQDGPNEDGHELWADYLTDYFISDAKGKEDSQ
ncbi:SGNH/GDSL hydrolase family protein [Rossellomorea sp. KS-H15a]|uniref:SGNH/GDSL hydrolase family protein n=1 Tax=Rossellomorea sp. KS-H15a TaxID=2963940 RepID=UPI0020C5F384|nr:SGNH/GDSL hydrolase family protein [Rossellomorea sp. KS-H15a]UTE77507.1 SGNH/GDSL hydrolase family protein [Rossellomorea sp. KS-H15a]